MIKSNAAFENVFELRRTFKTMFSELPRRAFLTFLFAHIILPPPTLGHCCHSCIRQPTMNGDSSPLKQLRGCAVDDHGNIVQDHSCKPGSVQFYCAKPLPTNQSHMENKQKNACNVFGCNCTTQCVDRNAPKMWCRDDVCGKSHGLKEHHIFRNYCERYRGRFVLDLSGASAFRCDCPASDGNPGKKEICPDCCTNSSKTCKNASTTCDHCDQAHDSIHPYFNGKCPPFCPACAKDSVWIIGDDKAKKDFIQAHEDIEDCTDVNGKCLVLWCGVTEDVLCQHVPIAHFPSCEKYAKGSYELLCTDFCKQRTYGSKGIYNYCNTANGHWDYCSEHPHQGAYKYTCKSECQRSYDWGWRSYYWWCYYGDRKGQWDYCTHTPRTTPQPPDEIIASESASLAPKDCSCGTEYDICNEPVCKSCEKCSWPQKIGIAKIWKSSTCHNYYHYDKGSKKCKEFKYCPESVKGVQENVNIFANKIRCEKECGESIKHIVPNRNAPSPKCKSSSGCLDDSLRKVPAFNEGWKINNHKYSRTLIEASIRFGQIDTNNNGHISCEEAYNWNYEPFTGMVQDPRKVLSPKKIAKDVCQSLGTKWISHLEGVQGIAKIHNILDDGLISPKEFDGEFMQFSDNEISQLLSDIVKYPMIRTAN